MDVVSEIEQLVGRSNVQTFSFVDQVFNIPKAHGEAICKEMIRRNLAVKWTAWFNEKHLNEDFLEIVKRAGCAYLSFSPDSASDKILRNLRKNLTFQDLSESLRLSKKMGMKAEYSFMLNAPGERLNTFLRTFIFIVKARLVLGRDFILHNILMITPIRIYPHTEIQKLAVNEGIIDEHSDLIEPVFYNPSPLKYLVNILSFCLRFIWRVKQLCSQFKFRQ